MHLLSPVFYRNPHLFEYLGLILSLLLLFGIASVFPKIESAKKVFGLGLLLTPIAYFYLIVDAHLVDIPFKDDYMLLETVHDFRQENNFIEAVKILFAQVNQHRFAFERLVMLALVFFTGTVNLKVLITLGNLFLLGILYLFFRTFSDERVSWYYFLPVPFLLFNLTFYENAFWGIAAIQNTPLIFFTLLSSYCLGRGDRTGQWIGAIAALIATFVSGTGMLAWIVGAVILFFQKKYKPLAVWITLAIGCLLFYFFFDYRFIPSAEASPPGNTPFSMGCCSSVFWAMSSISIFRTRFSRLFTPTWWPASILACSSGWFFWRGRSDFSSATNCAAAIGSFWAHSCSGWVRRQCSC